MTPASILLPLALHLGGVASQTAAGDKRQLKDVIQQLTKKALEGEDLKNARGLPDYMKVSNESHGNVTIFKLPRNLDGYNLEISFNAMGGVNVTHFVSDPVITVLVPEAQQMPRIIVGEDVVIDDDIFNTIFPSDLLENFENLQINSTTISTNFTNSTSTTTSTTTTTVTTTRSSAIPSHQGSLASLPCLPSLLLLASAWLLVFRG